MPYPLYVAFVWHMHQPFYKDLATGETLPVEIESAYGPAAVGASACGQGLPPHG